MRILAFIVSLLAVAAGFVFGIAMAFAPGSALFGVVPPLFMPVLSVLGAILVFFRPLAAAILLALSALVTSIWPFAMTAHLSGSDQLSPETIAFRSAVVAIPSALAALAAILAWLVYTKR